MDRANGNEEKTGEVFHADQQIDIKAKNDIFETCTCCGKIIRYGNALVEINRVTQQIDSIDGKGLVATVIDCDDLVTLCSECGNKKFMPSKIRKRLSEPLGINLPESHLVTPYKEFYTTPVPCDLCGCDIHPGNAEVHLDIVIGQADWSDEIEDSIITPIYAESLFNFCASCGDKMSVERLETEVNKVLVYTDKSESDDYWDPDNYDDDDEDDDYDWDDYEPAPAPVLGFYSKQHIPGLTASFGDIKEAMKYAVDKLIPNNRNYFIDLRGGWEIEANEPSCIQIVPENKVFDNKKLELTIHIPFHKGYYTDELIRFMEFPLYKHFERYNYKDIPCFAFQCGTDIEKLNRIVRLLLVEVFRYTTLANIECNIFDQGLLTSKPKVNGNPEAEVATMPANPSSDVKSDVNDVMTQCDYCGADSL